MSPLVFMYYFLIMSLFYLTANLIYKKVHLPKDFKVNYNIFSLISFPSFMQINYNNHIVIIFYSKEDNRGNLITLARFSQFIQEMFQQLPI